MYHYIVLDRQYGLRGVLETEDEAVSHMHFAVSKYPDIGTLVCYKAVHAVAVKSIPTSIPLAEVR